MSVRRVLVALAAAPLVSLAVSAATVMALGAHRRAGVSREQAEAALPSDALLPDAVVQNDRACLIHATPAQVWPWIAQLGQNKAGFYSFEAMENLAGCQISGATRIHPEWQQVEIGDPLALHPQIQLRLAQVEPQEMLAATNVGTPMFEQTAVGFTWAFHLQQVNDPSSAMPLTRLHVRERFGPRNRCERAIVELTSLVSGLMTWRMLTRIAALTEGRIAPSAEERADLAS